MTPQLLETNNTHIIFRKSLVYKRFTSGNFDARTIKDFVLLDKKLNEEPLIVRTEKIANSPFKSFQTAKGSARILVQKRLPERSKLSAIITKTKKPDHYLSLLANDLSSFHSNSKKIAAPSNYISVLFSNDIEIVVRGSSSDPVLSAITTKLQNAVIAKKHILETREIRELHGDVSLENIFYVKNKLAYTDFGHRVKYRTDDISKDVANIYLELKAYCGSNLAKNFLKKYIELSGDTKLSVLVPLYTLRILLVKVAVYQGHYDKEHKNSIKLAKNIKLLKDLSKNI